MLMSIIEKKEDLIKNKLYYKLMRNIIIKVKIYSFKILHIPLMLIECKNINTIEIRI